MLQMTSPLPKSRRLTFCDFSVLLYLYIQIITNIHLVVQTLKTALNQALNSSHSLWLRISTDLMLLCFWSSLCDWSVDHRNSPPKQLFRTCKFRLNITSLLLDICRMFAELWLCFLAANSKSLLSKMLERWLLQPTHSRSCSLVCLNCGWCSRFPSAEPVFARSLTQVCSSLRNSQDAYW